MSLSPDAEPDASVRDDEPDEDDPDETGPSYDQGDQGADAYARGWAAINKLMRRGHSWSGHEKNCAFLNLGDGTFADASFTSGFGLPDDGRALAAVDFDLDGALDLLITNRNTPRVRLLRGRGARSESVSIRLRGTKCNRDAIGARVELHARSTEENAVGRPLVRSVRAGEGYLAQSSAWLHFGLAAREVERVVVHWPGGEAEEIRGVHAGGAYVVEEGTGAASAWKAVERDRVEHDPEPLESGEPAADERYGRRIVLAAPLPLPRIGLVPASAAPSAKEIALFGVRPGGSGSGTGRVVLLNLMASYCAPCVAELEQFAERAPDLEKAGIAFLALSVDEDVADARTAIETSAWPFAWAMAPARTIEILDTIHGAVLDTEVRMPIPTSFLVDRSGALRVIYVGRIDPDRLFDDLVLLDLSSQQLLEHAALFPGRWSTPPSPSPSDFERVFSRRGLEETAREYSRADMQVVTTEKATMLHEFGRDYFAQGNVTAAIEAMRRATLEDPRFFAAHFDLGQLLQQQGEFHEAIAAYLGALRIDPQHVDARFNLALAYIETRQVISAERERRTLEEMESPLAEDLVPLIDRLREESERPRDATDGGRG